MAEYQEVVEQFRRMCKSTTRFECGRGKCPVMGYAFGCKNVGQCRKIAFERPGEFEGRVMAWAAAHPEPQYPTLAEWLRSMGLANHRMIDPIPADIAEKLGVKPKDVER